MGKQGGFQEQELLATRHGQGLFHLNANENTFLLKEIHDCQRR